MANQQYEDVCKGEFLEIKDAIKDMRGAVDGISKRLYYDNGTECLQSRLNRIDSRNKIYDKLIALIAAGVFIPLAYNFILSVYQHISGL